MLQADERDATPAHDQLARIRGADADHDVEVHRTIGLEQLGRTAQRVLGHRDDVHILEQAFEVGAIGTQRGGDDRLDMRRLGIEHVVLPVRAQHGTMAIEVLVVCRGGVWRGQRCEELRNEIYEHCAGCPPIWEGTQRISMSLVTRRRLDTTPSVAYAAGG